jgi:hypothetical protein
VGGNVDNVVTYDLDNHKPKFLTNLIYPRDKCAVLQSDKYLIIIGGKSHFNKIERIDLETNQNEELEVSNIHLMK